MFWPEGILRTDPDLTAVRSLPGFEEMVESVRRSEERANMNRPERPDILLFAPEAETVRGLLIALHMYARTAAESAPYWRSAAEVGLGIVVPESTQVSGDGEPAWTNAAMTARDLRLARQEALSRYPEGGLATVIGGASQGGGIAAAIALTGDPFDCRGLVGVVSAYPISRMSRQPRRWQLVAVFGLIFLPATRMGRETRLNTSTPTSRRVGSRPS